MELELNQDQELFRDTTRKFLESESPLTTVRALADDPDGFDRRWWQRGAELGWTALLVPEDLGGGSITGAGLLDLVLVAEEMGRLVAPGPLLPVNVVASALVASGTAEQRETVLPALVAGEQVATWCFPEPGRRWDAGGVELEAASTGDSFTLRGTKSPIEAAGQADHFLVTARTGGGLTQLLVPADTPGITVAPMESIDLVRRFAEVRFDDVTVPTSAVVGEVGGAGSDVERQLQVALAIQSAETVGATGRVFDFTLEYANDRYSFGRPIASYQALKHRFADMKLWLESSYATANACARAVQDGADDAAELVSVAASYIGDRTPEIVEDCVQMHGGIGVTWEHDIHLYLRRVTLNRALYGGPDEHRERLATLLGM
ncbi:MAG TPA: acyl-CoA dehydrogenase family protein [Acidimicrobiales bacterium]|nr:acyl-CoA dehydrogenase family protein [Acidimicrobiales bacterium]